MQAVLQGQELFLVNNCSGSLKTVNDFLFENRSLPLPLF